MNEYERFTLEGEKLMERLKHLIREGNVRRITVRDKHGETIFQAPLTFGIAGVALTPFLAAVGAVVALATDCSIEVERKPDPKKK